MNRSITGERDRKANRAGMSGFIAGFRSVWTVWTLSAMLLPASGAWSQLATTPYMDHGYVEQRMILKGPDGSLLKPENHLHALDGVAAHVTQDSLYVTGLRQACTLAMCGNECLASPFYGTVAFPLPGTREAKPPAFGLIRVVEEGADRRVTVVVARGGTTLHRMEVRLPAGVGGALLGTRTYALQGAGEGKVLAIAALRKNEDLARPGFLAVGSGGLARRVMEAANGVMSDQTLILSGGGDYTAAGQGFVATSTGDILIHQDWGFLRSYARLEKWNPSSSAGPNTIHRIDSLTAISTSGMAWVRRNEGWTAVVSAADPVVGVHPRYALDGTTLTLYSAGGTFAKQQSLGDAPSYMLQGFIDDGWSPPKKNDVYLPSAPRTFVLSFKDPDGNATPPHLSLKRPSGEHLLTESFVQADPRVGCAATGHCLKGFATAATLTLGPDSVRLTFTGLTGTRGLDAHCQTPKFTGRDTTFRLASVWGPGDQLTLALGTDSLTISNLHPNGILAGRRTVGRRGQAASGKSAAMVWRNGWIFDLAGRVVIPVSP